jgi:cellulose synthase/poly-beta-1,6-N-acetylglucosamine synthase-like glycosyltransferase
MDPIHLLVLLLIPYSVLALIILVKARHSKNKKDYNYKPTVTVYVPTFNEEKHIARKLDNLLAQTYPIKEILIIDCSTDKTVQIIEEYQRKYPSIIRLVKQPQRIGMARTLNEAFKLATGELFVKTDCDSVSEPNALKELVANFADKSVGGATGICVADSGAEKYFRKVMTAVQVAESNIDSTLIAHSPSLLAFRTSLVQPVKENSVADDTEEFLLIRKKGFKTIIDPAVISREEVPEDYRVRRTQKNRRSQGIVKVLLENFDMLLNPKYRKYGTCVLPMEWFILILSPMLLIAFTAVLGYVLYLIHPLLAVVLIGVITGALIQRSNMLFAIIDTELSGLVGFIKSVIKGNGDGIWQKVR